MIKQINMFYTKMTFSLRQTSSYNQLFNKYLEVVIKHLTITY